MNKIPPKCVQFIANKLFTLKSLYTHITHRSNAVDVNVKRETEARESPAMRLVTGKTTLHSRVSIINRSLLLSPSSLPLTCCGGLPISLRLRSGRASRMHSAHRISRGRRSKTNRASNTAIPQYNFRIRRFSELCIASRMLAMQAKESQHAEGNNL